MTRSEAIDKLLAAYPRTEITPATVLVYAEALADIPELYLVAACRELARTSRWLPTIAEIREWVAERMLQLPTGHEAARALRDWKNAPEQHRLVAVIRKAHGDGFDWRRDGHYMLPRAVKHYEEVRARAIREAMAGDLSDVAAVTAAAELVQLPPPQDEPEPPPDPSELDELRAS